ncbi:amidase [Gordonia sp. CPCC 205515]|uniref:amidase n=1 Tax=Gordonia sp. CPCC 205515 TaxID=3140791 RepID=UPI003AF3EC1C
MTTTPTQRQTPPLVEASIAELTAALADGRVTSVELVAAYLNRIAHYDRHGLTLNAVPVLNPAMFDEARASDERRARGESLGPFDGIPYTAKDSYRVQGLTVASGSPAFADLVAGSDAFAIERLRAAGAICLGLTNMPPMANGGMQRGCYGRAESPYNSDYLAAAYLSGSSNGSGVSTAASMAAFGLGEETWSSGRSPASNNALVAYTPSRGVISVRGNWPLTPTMDVVVPQTRTVDDLLALLDVLVADDADTRGDFWRTQPWVTLPAASEVRPDSYQHLRDPESLRGKRFGVPRIILGDDDEAGWPITPRPSVIELWQRARADLEAAGATVVDVDFPALTNYELDRPDARDGYARGILPKGFFDAEMWDLTAWSWDDYLQATGDPALDRLAKVDGDKIFPLPEGSIPDELHGYYARYNLDISEYPERAAHGIMPLEEIPDLAEGVRGLEELRRVDFEEWLDDLGLDALVFPSALDVGAADADTNPASHERAMANGVWVSTGNTMIRHYGIPTVNVTMGTMRDIGMPVNLTFAGRAYTDNALLAYGWAYEQISRRRVAPPSTPELPGLARFGGGATGPAPDLTVQASVSVHDEVARVEMSGTTDAELLQVFVNGIAAPVEREAHDYTISMELPVAELERRHSQWRGPYGSVVTAVATSSAGAVSARYVVVGGTE